MLRGGLGCSSIVARRAEYSVSDRETGLATHHDISEERLMGGREIRFDARRRRSMAEGVTVGQVDSLRQRASRDTSTDLSRVHKSPDIAWRAPRETLARSRAARRRPPSASSGGPWGGLRRGTSGAWSVEFAPPARATWPASREAIRFAAGAAATRTRGPGRCQGRWLGHRVHGRRA